MPIRNACILCILGCILIATSNAKHAKESHSNILIALPLVAKISSHCPPLSAISSALAQKGHHIQLLRNSEKACGDLESFRSSGVTEYDVADKRVEYSEAESRGSSAVSNQRILGKIAFFDSVAATFADMCRSLLEDKDLLDELRRQQFDIIIANLFSPCFALLAQYLNLPLIVLTTSREYPFFNRQVFGYPSELSYVPEQGSGLTSNLTLSGKIKNLASRMFLQTACYYFQRKFRTIQTDFNIEPSSSLNTIMARAKLWLSYSNLALDYPEPIMPNTVSIGGLAVKETQSLPTELDVFMQGSGDHGVIIFSLGSMIGSVGDDHVTAMIGRVFSRLPQRVVWKHKGAPPNYIGNNTKILDWIPQNDLLAHSKTRLFIGHGGLNGVYEALYHAVPMILIPLLAPDQFDNAARVASKGMGVYLDVKTLTEESFYGAITEVLHNQRYHVQVSHHSAIFHDLPPAKDRAVFWIEHVIKFGDTHLRGHVFELNFIQYYLLDVAAIFVLIAVLVSFVLRKLFRSCCQVCKGSKDKIE